MQSKRVHSAAAGYREAAEILILHPMLIHTDKPHEKKSRLVADRSFLNNREPAPGSRFTDSRPGSAIQKSLLQKAADHSTAQQIRAVQKKENKTGLPDGLKSGIENLSGYSMDDVRVHYNSGKPAQLQAHAYAQGSDIYLSAGQERHLPHEAWHVVQQKQGRVKPTLQLKSGIKINDDAALEQEASVMGRKAVQMQGYDRYNSASVTPEQVSLPNTIFPVQQVAQLAALVKDRLNVAGETHDESGSRRALEREVAQIKTGSSNYWQEGAFNERSDSNKPADPYQLRYEQLLQFGLSLQIDNLAANKKEDYINAMQYGDVDIIEAIEQAMNQFYADDLEFYGEKISGLLQIPDVWIAGLRRVILFQCNKAKPIVKKLAEECKIENDGFISFDYSALESKLKGSKELNDALSQIMEGLDEMNKALIKADQEFHLIGRDISGERSDAMHNAAQARYAEKGLWKVGEKHADDMSKKDNRRYNLLSKSDFNSELVM